MIKATVITEAHAADLLTICTNMRTIDKQELYLQGIVIRDMRDLVQQIYLWHKALIFYATDGAPIGVYGYVLVHHKMARVCGWATTKFSEYKLSAVHHAKKLIDDLKTDGMNRIECFTWNKHDSNKFLKSAGLNKCIVLKKWGKNGDDFFLRYWVRA